MVEVEGIEPSSKKQPRRALQPVETISTPEGWGRTHHGDLIA